MLQFCGVAGFPGCSRLEPMEAPGSQQKISSEEKEGVGAGIGGGVGDGPGPQAGAPQPLVNRSMP